MQLRQPKYGRSSNQNVFTVKTHRNWYSTSEKSKWLSTGGASSDNEISERRMTAKDGAEGIITVACWEKHVQIIGIRLFPTTSKIIS